MIILQGLQSCWMSFLWFQNNWKMKSSVNSHQIYHSNWTGNCISLSLEHFEYINLIKIAVAHAQTHTKIPYIHIHNLSLSLSLSHTHTHTHTYIHIYITITLRTPPYIYIYIWRRSRCNGYYPRKETQWPEFKAWTGLFTFPMALISMGKLGIQQFSLQLWINSRAGKVL